ncbi:MAG: ADP-ribosylglycohydrolase family protein [Lachnospiraceae bacterium]|nr:ADP-ribosylglycohydrolase family protein [Lachnospiraceae bacterium]
MKKKMLGALVGDIAGSYYEWHNIKKEPEILIDHRSHFTDDTVLTLAIADGLMNAAKSYDQQIAEEEAAMSDKEREAMRKMEERLGLVISEDSHAPFSAMDEEMLMQFMSSSVRKFARTFPYAGYGGRFAKWVESDQTEGYHSLGNGAAMRVSFCGWVADSPEEALRLAKASADITHNHPFGEKAAQAIAYYIYQLRNGMTKEEMRESVAQFYPIDFTLNQIRPTYEFDVTCDGSVPQAIEAFFEGDSFEEVIRLAISIGGDSDTIAAIAGSLAETIYEIPDDLAERAMNCLARELREVVDRIQKFL